MKTSGAREIDPKHFLDLCDWREDPTEDNDITEFRHRGNRAINNMSVCSKCADILRSDTAYSQFWTEVQ